MKPFVAAAVLASTARLAYTQTTDATEPAQRAPSSPVSDVPGLAFDRFYEVWLENIVRHS